MKTKSIDNSVVKKFPQRTCVACHQVGAKRGLVRLVRTSSGSIDIDVTGKKAGRGAYICRVDGCWKDGIKTGKLERSLRVALRPEERETLIRLGQDLIKESI